MPVWCSDDRLVNMATEQADTERPPISGTDWVHYSIRFILELVAWGAIAYWGWRQAPGTVLGALYAALCFVEVVAIWGVFATPGNSHRGKGLVAVAGWVRLLIEVVIFGLGAAALWVTWSRAASETFMTVAILNFALTWDRQWHLLRGDNRSEAS
jgi:hypothetical protein